VVGHDHLLNWYPGADGIKTGFINASGFNLATSAVQDGHRLIGVIMGGRSWQSRDRQMAAMLDKGFAQVETGGPGPEHGPEVADNPPAAAPVRTAEHPPAPPPPAAVREASATVPRSDAIGRLAAAALRDSPPSRSAKPTEDAPREGERWGIQIGAYRAQTLADRAVHKAARLRVTRGKPQQIVAARSERNPIYLARLVHFTPKAARAACVALHRRGMACEVVRPEELKYANR
jgi:D-alanyl-D-alanine carboxypeptidase